MSANQTGTGTVGPLVDPRLSFDTSGDPYDDHNADITYAPNAGQFHVVWDGAGGTLNTIRFNALSGNVSVGHQVVTAYNGTSVDHPTIASSGGVDDLVAYERGTGGFTDLVGARITSVTDHTNEFFVSRATGGQFDPSVAWNGVYLVDGERTPPWSRQ